jgi:hypothetical protein
MQPMSPVAETIDQPDVLRRKAARVDALVCGDLVGAPGRTAWLRELEDAVLDLSDALPEGTEDYDARKLLEFLVGLRRAVDADAVAGGTDSDGSVELTTMTVRDVVRRIARRMEHDELDDPRAAADAIFATLRGTGAGDLARLMGVSTKTVGAWRAGRPVARNAPRIVLVAQLLSYLRPTMTPAGLVAWFDAPREQLDGGTPLALLDAPAGAAVAREPLSALARGTRGQLAD